MLFVDTKQLRVLTYKVTLRKIFIKIFQYFIYSGLLQLINVMLSNVKCIPVTPMTFNNKV